ncbi:MULTISPECIES: tyrosine-type recombinase/integrase [Halolamina]|nr:MULTISPECIES: tyrosine-type recombinase/integrase [Halolamina]NHX37276.1 tyrosine-type recombinase/integrase [Halolamina sp. R1-12]
MSSDQQDSESYRVADEYAREYLSRNEGVTLASSSVETYDGHLTEYVSFLDQRDRTVVNAEFQDVLDYLDWCVRRGNRKSTLSSKLATIGELYRYIRLRTDVGDELGLDPIRFQEIDLNQFNTPPPIERDALSRDEIRRLFDAFDSFRNRLMAIVGVETGLRNSDIRNLRLEDIDENTIHVRNPKNSKPYDVPISNELAFEIQHWNRHHRPGYSAAAESPYLFPSQCGERLEANGSLNSIIRTAAERAGIQEVIGESQVRKQEGDGKEVECREWHRVTVHTLRHSFVTLLKDAGVNLNYRMLVANHADSDTTRGYTHGENEAFSLIRSRFDPPR